MTDDKILRQIAAALRIAEKAGTADEADNAMHVAQRLATRYSIDLAVARAHQSSAARAAPTHRSITLGEPRKRGLRTYVALFLAIARANDVTCNIAHNSTYVVAYGFADDIDVCEALYASLVVQMVRASDAFLAGGSHRQELTWRAVERTDRRGRRSASWEQVAVSGTSARITFHTAFGERVGERLAHARAQARAAAIEADAAVMTRVEGLHGAGAGAGVSGAGEPAPGGGASHTELVLVAKAAEVQSYYAEHSTARGSWRGGRASADASPSAQSAGRRAGSRARLGTEAAIGGSRRALGSGP